ncbi:FkbM family methyltransferase [Limnohabitans sp.]|uniref:FkbM family methyltransferase n=1 Tax=Limnohabitans sp. TaxID=1907725 RepID=UPI0031FDA40F
MSFVSYAQNYEDVMLWRALKNIENGFYIDVGAAWPDEDSVTKAFYDIGWRGINIEPNPSHYDSLKNQRQRDTNLKVAVGDKAGILTMNFLGETGLSTLVEEIANQHQANGWEISQKTVMVQTLQSICELYTPAGQVIHFLKIDVEGFEAEVLRGHDWFKYRPWIILVEATLPMTQHESYETWEPILQKAEYVFAYTDGINRYYVSQEKASELLKVLRYPPNVFDGYIRFQQHAAEQREQQAREEALAAQSQASQLSQQLALAQSKEQQTKEQLQQALNLAQTAQTQADQLNQQLAQAQTENLRNTQQINHHNWLQTQALQARIDALQTSWSWTLTAPLRWAAGLLLRPTASARESANRILAWGLNNFQAPLGKAMAWVLAKKGISETINRWLQGWPHLHANLIAIAHQQGILPTLPGQIVIKKKTAASGTVVAGGAQALGPDSSQLTPRGRQIYLQLQVGIKTNRNKRAS